MYSMRSRDPTARNVSRNILSFSRRNIVSILVGVCFAVWTITTFSGSADLNITRWKDKLLLETTLARNLRPNNNNSSPIHNRDDETLVICAIAKNATPYLEEWLDYNLALGFDHIYLYDNSVDFEISLFLEKYAGKDKVTLSHLPGRKKQIAAYRSCGEICREINVARILFIDVDEFLVLKKHDNIRDFCRTYRHSVVFNSQTFGTGGHKSYLPLPVTMRFRCMRGLDYEGNIYIKSFVRLADVDWTKSFGVHRLPLLNGSWAYDLLGRPIPPKGPWSAGTWKHAAIYHYYSKSNQEYLAKITRGDAVFGEHRNDPNISQPLGTIYDETLWRRLQALVPKYLKYEGHPLAKNLTWSCLPSNETTIREFEAFSNT